eukprot:NODE_585_length_5683_cov_0.592586.p5 type:complete len:147 gc:universal NODE_585_length_5683_cov_0.592586:4433-3993(-)
MILTNLILSAVLEVFFLLPKSALSDPNHVAEQNCFHALDQTPASNATGYELELQQQCFIAATNEELNQNYDKFVKARNAVRKAFPDVNIDHLVTSTTFQGPPVVIPTQIPPKSAADSDSVDVAPPAKQTPETRLLCDAFCNAPVFQ